VPVGVGEEGTRAAQRRGGRRLDDRPASVGRLLDRGGDFLVGGDMDGQDRFAVRLALQCGRDLVASELSEQLVGGTPAAGCLRS
jgi:hypothetical protein